MAKVGRKTKLTPELKEQIVKYVEAGNYAKVACQAVDISEQTYYTWIKRGKAGEKQFLEFLESIRGAEARAEIRNVTMINIAAKKDWRAALEMLARKYHKRWGLKKQIGGIGEEPIKIEIKNKDLEKKLIDKLNIMAERYKKKKNIKKRK